MNSVSLVGELVADPELDTNWAGIDECRMRLAVPRRSRDGRREPGVVYVDVTTYGLEAQECAEHWLLGAVWGSRGGLRTMRAGTS